MIAGITLLYQTIAESIAGNLQEPWVTAWMDVIFYPDQIFYSGEYVSTKTAQPKGFPTDIRGEEAFEQLRELFKLAGKPLWCRARFELHSDGKFNMNLGYDDSDENGFAKFDEEAEIKRMRELRNRLA